MQQTKKWEVIHKLKIDNKKLTIEKIVDILVKNRGLITQKDIQAFLHPKSQAVTIKSVGIDEKQLQKAIKRITKALEKKEKIIIYGDYDVDGITGTAILWETLHALGANVLPYIPSRFDQGYGLSIAGINNIKNSSITNSGMKLEDASLIITVDNGIVATDAVDYANTLGIDVIITDHHTPPVGKLPDALAIVHTTKLCGAGVGWMLSKIILSEYEKTTSQDDKGLQKLHQEHLALVALATVADLVPLTGANRTLLIFGLPLLQQTKRPGLQALYKEAELSPITIGVYEIGHIIGPRLNAMGRMASAMDSLRLICTKDGLRAKVFAEKLSLTNKERQLLTKSLSDHAKEVVLQKTSEKKLLFIHHKQYEQGVIGLIAGKLVEEFYRPAIVLSKGEKYSKASARSVAGFNIIEFIRSASHLLIDAGGHPMAAGFTLETEKILLLQETLEALAEKQLTEELLTRTVKIDCEIPLEIISKKFYETMQQLAPFGMANAEPTFISRNVKIADIRAIGKEAKHLKLKVSQSVIPDLIGDPFKIDSRFRGNDNVVFDAIAFGMGEKIKELSSGQEISLAFIVAENTWNGKTTLQLKVKDIKIEMK